MVKYVIEMSVFVLRQIVLLLIAVQDSTEYRGCGGVGWSDKV